MTIKIFHLFPPNPESHSSHPEDKEKNIIRHSSGDKRAADEAAPAAGRESATASATEHKQVNTTKTVQKLAEADQPDSPITVSSPEAEETEEIRETGEDSNLSRSKATQTDSDCTSQAVQTGNLSQERV